MADQDNEKKSVSASRRRRTTSSGDRERADAPERERAEKPKRAKPSTRPSSSKPSGSDGPTVGQSAATVATAATVARRGGLGPRGVIVVVVLVALFMLFRMCTGGGDQGETFDLPAPPAADGGSSSGDDSGSAASDFVESASSAAAAKSPAPKPSAEGATWTIMLYQDADDKILEKDIYVDLNEAERIGSTDQVNIVAQVDRYRQGYKADGNWDSTKRFYVTYDPDLERVSSQEIMDIGEANMADGQTLVDFVKWSAENYPADNYVLIMSDHGMGWPGGWSDPAPGGKGPDRIALANALGDELFLMELDDALGQIRAETDIDKFEMIGLDACLMSHVEVYDALAPHANYAVASQETEPALGWAYTGFLGDLIENPDMSGAEFSQTIVDTYITEDQRILDENARADLTGRSRGFGLPSARQVSDQMIGNTTLSAIDLNAMPQMMNSLNELAYQLQGVDQRAVAKARTHAQGFTSIFGKSVPASYLDLGHLAQLLAKESRDPNVAAAAEKLLTDIDRAVIAEKHGRNKSGATGLSIYFPNSQLYRSPVAGPQSYAEVADRFAAESTWDDFLAFHYTGREFQPVAQLTAPPATDRVTAPGASAISVSSLKLSADSVAPGDVTEVSADIQGDSIGNIYFFTGYIDEDDNSINVADMDYIESPDTREVDGVFYPDWGADEFELNFEWEPIVFAIDDGEIRAEALFNPETYGASFEDSTYTVDGVYQYTDGEQRNAKLYFQNGELISVFGFTGEGGVGAPREIIPELGDQFTVLERWMDLDARGRVVDEVSETAKTVTFGQEPLTWVDLDAAAGEYIVGFIVEDMDGNSYPAYATVTVE